MNTATKRHPAQRAVKPAVRTDSAATAPLPFDWPLANEAEHFLRQRIETFLERNYFAHRLAQRMLDETGTDFFEWVDHLVLPAGDEEALSAVGFVRDPCPETPDGEAVYHHPLATLPRLLLRRADQLSVAALATVAPRLAALSDALDGAYYSSLDSRQREARCCWCGRAGRNRQFRSPMLWPG